MFRFKRCVHHSSPVEIIAAASFFQRSRDVQCHYVPWFVRHSQTDREGYCYKGDVLPAHEFTIDGEFVVHGFTIDGESVATRSLENAKPRGSVAVALSFAQAQN